MQKALLFKFLITGFLALLLLWPLAKIGDIVGERMQRYRGAVAEIAASYAGGQRIVGPVLVLPYTEDYATVVLDKDSKASGTEQRGGLREDFHRHEGRLYLTPEALSFEGKAGTDFKHRGLFKALVFGLEGSLHGRFQVPAKLPVPLHSDRARITWGQPFLSLGLTDTRGLSREPSLLWQGEPATLAQGSQIALLPSGIHAPVNGIEPGSAATLKFILSLGLRGTEELGFVPLAGNTRVSLDSPWPHPSFGGRFLPNPQTQSVGEAGFHAEWEIPALASGAGQALQTALANQGTNCTGGSCLESFQVRFVESVNSYSLVDRALKYAFLFVLLGFAAFFLFELIKDLPIHPAQYLLVGLALALFFLLLLSFSEHLDFGLSYLLASAASIALQAFYLSYVLGGVRRGLAFAGLLGALFAALYGLLISEDNALLMGSLLLFALLAVTMYITRGLDWYALQPRGRDPGSDPARK